MIGSRCWWARNFQEGMLCDPFPTKRKQAWGTNFFTPGLVPIEAPLLPCYVTPIICLRMQPHIHPATALILPGNSHFIEYMYTRLRGLLTPSLAFCLLSKNLNLEKSRACGLLNIRLATFLQMSLTLLFYRGARTC